MYEVFVELLKEHGVKTSDVAKATGIPQSTFTDWKKGRSKPKTEKLSKIAEYFGVQTDYLLTGDIRYKEMSDIAVFMDSLKSPERYKEKQNYEYMQKFSKLGDKDREEIMRIIDMKLEMSNEG